MGDTAPNTSEEMLQKTIISTDFRDGGFLNALQQDRFISLVKSFQVMLNSTRMIRMPRPTMDIDKLHFGEPVTFAATEDTVSTDESEPLQNKVVLNAVKVQSQWFTSTETFQGNIEQNRFETTLMDGFTQRISTDIEDLAINGDATITGLDKRSKLLKANNGWDKLSDEAHIVNVNGAEIQKGIWVEAHRSMPKQFRGDPGLRWLVSNALAIDWMDLISDRQTVMGDNAMRGVGINPLGIPMIQVPLIPDDKAITQTAEATSAKIVSKNEGPFKITTGVNDVIIIDVDNIGAGTGVTVTLPQGTFLAVEVAKEINDQLVTGGQPAVADDDGNGNIVLESPSAGTGAPSEIDVQAGSTAVTTGGIRVGSGVSGITVPNVVAGVDAGTSGDILEGTFLWLSNPQNFIVGLLDATRVFTEFNKDRDRVETVVYNQMDVEIENLDQLVKVTNVRRRQVVFS